MNDISLLISHRGNTTGPQEDENCPSLIKDVLQKGFHVETDLWYIYNNFWLGHDEPKYKINIDFFTLKNVIYHAKNLNALEFCLQNSIHTFWHQEDEYTLTSYGYIWVYPGKEVTNNYKSIIVDNNSEVSKYDCHGICSDYVQLYKTCNI